jgi:hypothetical protein
MTAMPENTFYLEAPGRTQDLLTIKWGLRAAEYAIGSTWHEDQASTSGLAFGDHWNARGMEQLQLCDSLGVICGKRGEATIELAMIAGFALARGLRVFWIGSPLPILNDFSAVEQFNTAEDFRKHVLDRMHPAQSRVRDQLLAA